MKSWELLPHGRNHIEEAIEEIREYLRDHPEILKETAGYDRITSFLNLHLSNSEKPIIGNKYIPVQITSQSFAEALAVRILTEPGILLKIDEINRAYTFEVNGKIEPFPKGERKMGDITQWGLLYKNKTESTQFLELLKLSFGDWDIKIVEV